MCFRNLWSRTGTFRASGTYDMGDGHKSILFAMVPPNRDAPTVLQCFSEAGVERWRFVPGHTVRTAREEFAPPYRMHRFAVGRLGRDQQVRIVVTSYHHLYFPNQVALLSGDGKLLREYWHSGGSHNWSWLTLMGRARFIWVA